ncbi:MAG: hypothetical protein KBC00_00135 [Candidatus Levybacteria bacterium]|nr:hypothetical protein [Candidatus Levybacteria bacterium]MBP9815216.1 hypothetical protein [Candidatus Levybacteria bacterium]
MMDAIAFWGAMTALGAVGMVFVSIGGRESVAGFFLLTFVTQIAFSAIGHDLQVNEPVLIVLLVGVVSVLLGVLITTLSGHIILDLLGLLFFTVGVVVLLDETKIGDPLIRELQELKTVSEMRDAKD